MWQTDDRQTVIKLFMSVLPARLPPQAWVIHCMIADITKKIFQISTQIIIAVSQVTAVCRVILLYEARVMNSLLGNCNLGTGLQCWILGRCAGLAPRPPHIRAPRSNVVKVNFSQRRRLSFWWNFTDNVKSRRYIVTDRRVLIHGQHRFRLLCIHIANEKLMDVSVRALTKWHVPRPYIGKCGCILENCRATASQIIRCLR